MVSYDRPAQGALFEEARPALERVLRVARALCRAQAAEIAFEAEAGTWRCFDGGEVFDAAPSASPSSIERDGASWRAIASIDAPGVVGRIGIKAAGGGPPEDIVALLSDLAAISADDIASAQAQRQHAELLEQSIRSQERLRIAVENADLHVYECDYANRTLFKEGAEDTFFDQPKTYRDLATNVWGDIHPDDLAEAVSSWERSQASGGKWRAEYRFVRAGGREVWVSSSARLITDANGRPLRLIGALQDITPRKALEQQFEEAIRRGIASLEAKRELLDSISADLGRPAQPRTQSASDAGLLNDLERLLAEIEARDAALKVSVDLLRASRSAAQAADLAKSRFIASMSHELRTPLNAVIGYSEMLEEDLTAANMTRPALDVARIRAAAIHLLNIITDILEFTEAEREDADVRVTDVDVGALIAGLAQGFSVRAEERGNRLTCEAPARLIVQTDEAKLRRCTEILLANACKFTSNGAIELNASESDGELAVAVRDTGEGIPETRLASLFLPFTQVESGFTRPHDGAGMGLAICWRLVRLLGGDVSVESAVGAGSTFTLRLPIASVLRRTA